VPQRRCLFGLVAALLVAGPGCADPEERSTTWSYLHATIIEPSCATANCHSAFGKQKGIDLSEPDVAYRSLTKVDCGGDPLASPDSYVQPAPTGAESLLEAALHGRFPSRTYPQMPVDLPLAPGEIRLIATWVDLGAPCQ
jgi:hypothetical protein